MKLGRVGGWPFTKDHVPGTLTHAHPPLEKHALPFMCPNTT